MTFIVSSERDRGEMDGPETIVDFLEGDRVPGERRRDKQRRVPPRDAAVAADQTDFHVPRIVDGRQPRRQDARRARVTPGRRFVVHRLVRALFVVLADESAKALLLRGAVGCGRARRFGFQHAMKLLMRAVLFQGVPARSVPAGWPNGST